MTRPRDPDQIQREIEATRTQLAGTLDELAEQARERAVEFLRTPAGMAVLGGVTLLVALGVARRVRNRNR